MTLKTAAAKFPHPNELRAAAKAVAEQNDEYTAYVTGEKPGFEWFTFEDGAGNESRILFAVDKEDVTAALMYVYDNESSEAPSLDDENVVITALVGAPAVFAPLLGEGSPLLWAWEDTPATMRTVFASSAAWNTGSGWDVPAQSDTDAALTEFKNGYPGFNLDGLTSPA